ncbi:unnamed protein product [Diamesa hyperborea]
MDLNKVLAISTAVAIPNLGLIGGFLSYKSSQETFDNGMEDMKLSKKWLLPVFLGLQSAVGYGSHIIWEIGNDLSVATKSGIPMLLYGSQLLLSWSWPAIFGRSLKWVCYKKGVYEKSLSIHISQSFIESIGLTALASATAFSFYQADHTAGLLCLPYVGGLIYLNIENYLAYKRLLEMKKEEAAAAQNAAQSTKKRKAL